MKYFYYQHVDYVNLQVVPVKAPPKTQIPVKAPPGPKEAPPGPKDW